SRPGLSRPDSRLPLPALRDGAVRGGARPLRQRGVRQGLGHGQDAVGPVCFALMRRAPPPVAPRPASPWRAAMVGSLGHQSADLRRESLRLPRRSRRDAGGDLSDHLTKGEIMPGVTSVLTMDSAEFDRWMTIEERDRRQAAQKSNDAFVAAMNKAIKK